MTDYTLLTPEVAIVGAGPAGLSAARVLAGKYGHDVLVIDRESEAGGIPRHADHLGYGIRDRKRFMTGPAYARSLARGAEEAGARIQLSTQVTGWADAATLEATSPQGVLHIRPRAFIFATGARERPRTARRIPGDRPAGVLTTGQLQNLVHIQHQKVGKRAVIVGGELVSWSAALTLRESGCATVAIITRFPKSESYGLFSRAGKILFRTKVMTNSQVVAIHGRGRVESVEVEDKWGRRQVIDCDTVVFTGDWIADNEILKMAGVELDPATTGPVVDSALRTSKPAVFAAGNLNHPVDQADTVAQEGEFCGHRVHEFLAGSLSHERASVMLIAEPPLRWISPSRIARGDDAVARSRYITWVDEFIAFPEVIVTQDGKTIARKKVPWPAAPGRAFRIPASALADIDPSGGEVRVTVR